MDMVLNIPSVRDVELYVCKLHVLSDPDHRHVIIRHHAFPR